jgi:subtilase family protein
MAPREVKRSGMRGLCSSILLPSTLLGLAALFLVPSAPADAADPWRARVSAKLLAIYDAAARGQSAFSGSSSAASESSAAAAPSSNPSPFAPRFDASGRVQVDVRYDCTSPVPRAALTSAGLSVDASVDIPPLCVAEGWAAPAALANIASLEGVTSVTLPSYALPPHPPPRAPAAPASPGAPRGLEPAPRARPQSSTGSVIDGNGIAIVRADQFVSQTGNRGTGVTVGVQSTGVASLALIQQRGELPAVQVLTPSGGSNSNHADEGTVLLEEVHAIAPGARLAFCGPNTFVEYTSCLQQLISAGATILLDDVIFTTQDLMSANNTDTQAVQTLLTRNPSIALFTSVGNYNGSYWEGAYAPVSLASQNLPALTCPLGNGTQTDVYVAEFGSSPSEQLTVSQGGTFPLIFAWADPYDANVSDFDLYWSNNADATQTGCFTTAGVNGNMITPSVTLQAGTYTVYVATPDTSSAGKFLKLWLGGDGLTFLSPSTPGGIVSAQAYAPSAITIGAVNGSDGVGNQIENFSSLGPLSLFFPTPETQQAPTLVAPDGIYVDAAGTYFASLLFPDGNFYGTSASVPNAAAVAALLRGAFPQLTVPQLVQALTSGAAQLGGTVPDDTYGYGRVDAMGALATLTANGLQPSPSPPLPPPTSSTVAPSSGGGGAVGWPELATLALLAASSASLRARRAQTPRRIEFTSARD